MEGRVIDVLRNNIGRVYAKISGPEGFAYVYLDKDELAKLACDLVIAMRDIKEDA